MPQKTAHRSRVLPLAPQAPESTAPILPFGPVAPERQSLDNTRLGATTLFAAFNIHNGKSPAPVSRALGARHS